MERHTSDSSPEQADAYMDMVPWVNLYLKLRHSLVVEGLENIQDKATMFVANHLAFDDSLAIAAAYVNHTGKPLRLGAKSEYFEGKGVNNKGLFGKPIQKFVTSTQQMPVYRDSNPRGTVLLAQDVKRRLSLGESILFHGEGTRSIDGRLNKIKRGAATFAIKNHALLGPSSINYEKMPFSFRTAAIVRFGEALEPVDYGMEFHHYALLPDALVDSVAPRMMNQKERIDAVSDILEKRIADLSGQERSGYYLDPYTKKLIIPEDEITPEQ